MRSLPVLLLVAAAACSKSPKHHDAPPAPVAQQVQQAAAPTSSAKVVLATPGGDVSVAVELADTDAKIERGLMYRRFLGTDDGMLFLMDEEKVQTFWMRNTLIPLDMIFITKDFVVAGVVENAEPRTETLRSVGRPSSYVLEVNGGWAAAHQVTTGTVVRFDGVVR